MGISSLWGQEAAEGSLRGRSKGCQCSEWISRGAEQKPVPLARCGHSCPGKQTGGTWSRRMKMKKNVVGEYVSLVVFWELRPLPWRIVEGTQRLVKDLDLSFLHGGATSTRCRSPGVSNLSFQSAQ